MAGLPDAECTRTSSIWNVHHLALSGRSLAIWQLRRNGRSLACASRNTFIACRSARIERSCNTSCSTRIHERVFHFRTGIAIGDARNVAERGAFEPRLHRAFFYRFPYGGMSALL